MAQTKFHSLEMARSSFGPSQGERGGPTGKLLSRTKSVTGQINGNGVCAELYLMSWQRPHSRQILKLCSRVVRSSKVLAASSRREARIALRHFLIGTSWNKCLRKISARRFREKHRVSNTSPTSPAVGPLRNSVCRWNSLRNKINSNGFLNHGSGESPHLFACAVCGGEPKASAFLYALSALRRLLFRPSFCPSKAHRNKDRGRALTPAFPRFMGFQSRALVMRWNKNHFSLFATQPSAQKHANVKFSMVYPT